MNKYIDADLLREKITEQMKSLPREVGRGAGTITTEGYGMMEAFQIMRSIIDSLQQEQPEVDLEKELNRYLRGEFQQTAGGNFNNYIQVASHFYELGLKARKEE